MRTKGEVVQNIFSLTAKARLKATSRENKQKDAPQCNGNRNKTNKISCYACVWSWRAICFNDKRIATQRLAAREWPESAENAHFRNWRTCAKMRCWEDFAENLTIEDRSCYWNFTLNLPRKSAYCFIMKFFAKETTKKHEFCTKNKTSQWGEELLEQKASIPRRFHRKNVPMKFFLLSGNNFRL